MSISHRTLIRRGVPRVDRHASEGEILLAGGNAERIFVSPEVRALGTRGGRCASFRPGRETRYCVDSSS
jgi:hypothetical protein